ncbi:MAG: thiamine pyrophosphate-dependent dehydrogenase E1 component subunit alpha, partial [Armatimonadetes bacterium]|nr:thiamine pyrophosphate-dependent dehydrogenase E1 component subunit alpha [Armatimonadota bacterium]
MEWLSVLDDALKQHMLRGMYRIRLFEDRLKGFYDYSGFYGDGTIVSDARTVEDMLTCVMYDFDKSGLIGGAVHVYIGQEAVAVGVCSNLRDTDWVTSYHRGHGHALAKGLGYDGMMAELMGRASGYSRGCGGSMHIYDADHGLLGGNGIVGAQMPLSLGPAFAAKYRGEDGVSVAFFGDGAINQGTFNEAMNLAALWQLPVIFVCENNLFAASTPSDIAHATPDLAPRAEGYGVPWAIVDGQDVLAVHEAAREAVERARSGGGPTMIEAKTFRFQSHAGAGQSDHQDPELRARWMERDPIRLFEARLIEEGVMSADEQAAIREELTAELEAAVEKAVAAPFPETDILE